MKERIDIEQAIFAVHGANSPPRLLARSAAFLDDWLGSATNLCSGFGERPLGVVCPESIFAKPLDKHHVAVVQAADQGTDDGGRPTVLCFRMLIVSRRHYTEMQGDPFALVACFPPPWHVRGELPALAWPDGLPGDRSVAEIQQILKRPDSAALLGGAQALVDGACVCFERDAPDPDLIRSLWKLLPSSTRSSLWPASFAFDNALGFDGLVVPSVRGKNIAGYLTEEQAAEYPEGRYELHLQIAAEAGDQDELNALFARRSRAQTWQLGILLLVIVVALALAMKVLSPTPQMRPRPNTPALIRPYAAISELMA